MRGLRVGDTVRVCGSDRLMQLMAVEDRGDRAPAFVVFVRPLGGGVEHMCPMTGIEPVCEHEQLAMHPDGKRCSECGALIYARRIRGR